MQLGSVSRPEQLSAQLAKVVAYEGKKGISRVEQGRAEQG